MRHNPFMYFHSIIDNETRCKAHVVPLTALPGDLQKAGSTPNYVFITPNLCNDGHDTNCKNGDPGGLVSIDAFLKKWIPRITGSPAYKKDGLLIAPSSAFDPMRKAKSFSVSFPSREWHV